VVVYDIKFKSLTDYQNAKNTYLQHLQSYENAKLSIDNQKAYMLEIEFPNLLVTNYVKELTFSQEMIGIAEITTEDLRLLDKFLNPVMAVAKRKLHSLD
jgi:hypothetical protein